MVGAHNFIHPDVAEKLRLQLSAVPPFRVYVGNGDSLVCDQQCTATPLTMQSYEFAVDLYVLKIHGPQVVLGVQWLQTLGKVTHDYAQLTMEFTLGDRPVLLKGDRQGPRLISLTALQSLFVDHHVAECFEVVPVASAAVTDSAPTNAVNARDRNEH